MLKVSGVWLFVNQETIDTINSTTLEKPDFLKTANIMNSDHIEDSFPQTIVYVPSIEIAFSPYNSFHYEGDFEIGLAIEHGSTISDLELFLSRHGFLFESGYFGGVKENGYYSIPQKDGIFTPFHIASASDPRENEYSPRIKLLEFEVKHECLDTTLKFIEIFNIHDSVDIRVSSGTRNKIIRMISEVDIRVKDKVDLKINRISMEFYDNIWEIRMNSAF